MPFDKTTLPHLPPGFDPKVIKIFLFAQYFANLFVNIDMGILPAGSLVLKKELGMNNAGFGFLGSIVYVGQTIGSLLATRLLQSQTRCCNPKFILASCLFLNIGTLILFTLTTNYMVLVICRMCTGLFQVFFCIYFPVWADVFGDEIQKSTWMTYLLIASPIGVVLGYGMCAAMQHNIGWRWAFYIQAILLMPSMISLTFMPLKYFDVNGSSVFCEFKWSYS